MKNEFKCSKCKKSPDHLYCFGPFNPPEKEIGKEYCQQCWENHPDIKSRPPKNKGNEELDLE